MTNDIQKEMDIIELSKIIGTELKVKYMKEWIGLPIANGNVWMCKLDNVDILEGSKERLLRGEYGSGKTENEAIKDYCHKISFETINIGGRHSDKTMTLGRITGDLKTVKNERLTMTKKRVVIPKDLRYFIDNLVLELDETEIDYDHFMYSELEKVGWLEDIAITKEEAEHLVDSVSDEKDSIGIGSGTKICEKCHRIHPLNENQCFPNKPEWIVNIPDMVNWKKDLADLNKYKQFNYKKIPENIRKNMDLDGRDDWYKRRISVAEYIWRNAIDYETSSTPSPIELKRINMGIKEGKRVEQEQHKHKCAFKQWESVQPKYYSAPEEQETILMARKEGWIACDKSRGYEEEWM